VELGTRERAELEQVLRAERGHLVRWCARLVGNPDIAEDLVQDALSAAWRSQRRPARAEEYPAWLAGIVRNMSRSWRRRQWREDGRTIWLHDQDDQPAPGEEELFTEPGELTLDLEREELAHLLDRALALLPADTRGALVARYVEESPLAEVAACMGMTEGAVAARLHRGKLALRRALNTDLRAEAATYGLVRPDDESWHETRIWCPDCGTRRLIGRMTEETSSFALRCPACFERSHSNLAGWPDAALFHGLSGFRAALSRLSAAGHAYYARALAGGATPCLRCGQMTRVRFLRAEEVPPGAGETICVRVECPHCRLAVIAGLRGLALCHPAVQRFWRAHSRLTTLPERLLDVEGRRVVLTSFQAWGQRARLDVLTDPLTLETVHIADGAPGV
jgi:RNA polymerase sigma-70 factor (ECF subfamily)